MDTNIHLVTLLILQEAWEKAEEIEVITDEAEREIRLQILEKEGNKLDLHYSKKENVSLTKRRIALSQLVAKGHLAVLKHQFQIVTKILDETRTKAKLIPKKPNYKDVLYKAVLEGILMLTEGDVWITVSKQDVTTAKQMLKDLYDEYTAVTNKRIRLNLITNKHLDQDDIGGAIITARNHKIILDNTINNRITITGTRFIPQIKAYLFGINTNRKHMD